MRSGIEHMDININRYKEDSKMVCVATYVTCSYVPWPSRRLQRFIFIRVFLLVNFSTLDFSHSPHAHIDSLEGGKNIMICLGKGPDITWNASLH